MEPLRRARRYVTVKRFGYVDLVGIIVLGQILHAVLTWR